MLLPRLLHARKILARQRQRLFAEDVLAVPCGHAGLLRVELIGTGDEHDVDVTACAQLGGGAECVGDAELGGDVGEGGGREPSRESNLLV